MYLGNMVELSESEELFKHTYHPYTEALLSAIPTTEEDNGGRERILLEGDIPSPVNPPSGCKFHTRCRYCQEKCKNEVPEWRDMGNHHYVACHFPLKAEGLRLCFSEKNSTGCSMSKRRRNASKRTLKRPPWKKRTA